MAELSTKRRNELAPGKFALPEKDGYPVPDRSHAANAKARATQMYQAGKLSAADRARVNRKANAVLGKKK